MKRLFSILNRDHNRLTQICASITLFLSIALALPAIMVPLGLPAEGDAIDYRIPIVKWLVHHLSYPNMPFSMVDDYPLLGELLMAPLHSISPGLARLIPISAFIGLGIVGGLFTKKICELNSNLKPITLFLAGAAFTLSLRPLALQSNLFMVDNLASFFLLATFYSLFSKRIIIAGFFCALALATRYNTWANCGILAFSTLFLFPKERLKSFFIFCIIASLGALPYMIRNYLINGGNPFFPIGDAEAMSAVGVNNYGRGKDIISFLLLPFDILYTNTYVNGFFDYTIGKHFYLQLFFFLPLLFIKKLRPRNIPQLKFLLFFILSNTILWFLSGQQLRFLVPSLIAINLFMLNSFSRIPLVLALLSLMGTLSAYSIQKDSLEIAFGKKPILFQEEVDKARECYQRAGVDSRATIGFLHRKNISGFFDNELFFFPGHPYGIKANVEQPLWIYPVVEKEGYVPYPSDSPCIMKRKN